jgi:5'-3' exonuclease
VLCNGFEADDELGVQQDKVGLSTVICSIDKDLKQVPGRHYNFVKKEASVVTEEEGKKFLYLQSLIGDRSDNIVGVAGLGPVKAARALEGLSTEREWYERCRELYNDDERYHLNLHLLYIWQKPNDKWAPPTPSNNNNREAEHPDNPMTQGIGVEGQQQQQQLTTAEDYA